MAGTTSIMRVDVIADVHGHADLLEQLLQSMGWRRRNGYYSHHLQRHCVFVGDIINRGPSSRSVVDIVRSMVDNGVASLVLGNHECDLLRSVDLLESSAKVSASAERRAAATIAEYRNAPAQFAEMIRFLRRGHLLWWCDTLRVAHAWWAPEPAHAVASDPRYPTRFRNGEALVNILRDPRLGNSVRSLVHGPVHPDAYQRRSAWWAEPTLLSCALDDPRPLIVGHYCLRTPLQILHPRATSIDFCVAGLGRLAGYRHDGETELTADRLVAVEL